MRLERAQHITNPYKTPADNDQEVVRSRGPSLVALCFVTPPIFLPLVLFAKYYVHQRFFAPSAATYPGPGADIGLGILIILFAINVPLALVWITYFKERRKRQRTRA